MSSNRSKLPLKLLIFLLIFLWIFLPASSSVRKGLSSTNEGQNKYLESEDYETLDEIFITHLNYFLSDDAITAFGFPLTAYKVGDRARYGYSNPTEWGYAIQAWIAAAERGVITQQEAVNRISLALTTITLLQSLETESCWGFFYPYYTSTNSNGNDIPLPYNDGDIRIPSGDNALLYASLIITEGWARNIENASLVTQTKDVRDNMSEGFSKFLFTNDGDMYIAHQKNCDNDGIITYSKTWYVFSDEGGIVTWLTYFSDAISFNQYKTLTLSQDRSSALWYSCDGENFFVQDAAKYNAMFTWGIRSLAGFPIGKWEYPIISTYDYSRDSFIPNIDSHLTYADCIGIHYPAFSDAMTQTGDGYSLVGRYTPPNLDMVIPEDPPNHVMPHALFIPFNALPDLDSETIDNLMTKIRDLMNDQAGYYHDTGDYPFGFEVVTSPYKDDITYSGPDEGRPIFETLSHAYTTLSLFNGLQLDDGNKTFVDFARNVPGYDPKLIEVLEWLYPLNEHQIYLPLILNPPKWCDLGEHKFGSGDSPYPEEKYISISKDCVSPGLNTIKLESANPVGSGYWFVWDSLHLKTVGEDLIWILGDNEAPPEYGPPASDEFDQGPNFNTCFDVDQMDVDEFPKEMNDLTFSEIYITFYLDSIESMKDLRLFADTLYASHDEIPYFNLNAKVVAGNVCPNIK